MPEPLPPREGVDDCVAGQEELAEIGAVIEIRAGLCVTQKGPTAWQWLVPEQLVVSSEGRTVRIRVPP